jgi:dienelactone hydrolase
MLTATQVQASREVLIPAGDTDLAGTLMLPDHPSGIVLFVHGSGSTRESPRNRRVALRLKSAGLGALLFDLLTPREAESRGNRFDITLLAERLLEASRWIRAEYPALPIGWFGASTGAAAALVAAALAPRMTDAIVARGGRPDLAGAALRQVRVPTLLIVGGNDLEVLELNRQALHGLSCDKAMRVIPNAGHLFEEGNALDLAADYARHWFVRHLAGIGRHLA